jgi:CheY-like chemotaxis protein
LIEPDNEAHSTNKQEKKEKVDDGKEEAYEITVSSEDTLTDIVDTGGVTISSKFMDVSFMDSPINGLDLPSFNFQLPKIELSKINLPSVSLSALLSRLSGWKDETRKTSTEIETNVTVSEKKQENTVHAVDAVVDPNPEVNILLIEDQKVHADLILGSLGGSNNLKVVHAESGKNGLKQLRRKYDVVIVDTSLNDVEANIILSEMERWKVDTPVILLSEDVKSQTVSIAGEAHILDRTLVSYKSLPRVINNLPIKPSNQ